MLELMLGNGVRSGPIDSGPGPKDLIAGDINAGFYGEVPVGELVNGSILAATIGLTAGTAQFQNEPWLKFALDGKTLFVAKKPFRHSLSWLSINTIGAIYGTKGIILDNRTFKVRVLKSYPNGWHGGNDYGWAQNLWHSSEWNRLMYHVSGKPFGSASNSLGHEGITEGDWAKYSEADLYTYADATRKGTFSICQDRQDSYGNAMVRGGNGVSYGNTVGSNWTTENGAVIGWRPCLELVN